MCQSCGVVTTGKCRCSFVADVHNHKTVRTIGNVGIVTCYCNAPCPSCGIVTTGKSWCSFVADVHNHKTVRTTGYIGIVTRYCDIHYNTDSHQFTQVQWCSRVSYIKYSEILPRTNIRIITRYRHCPNFATEVPFQCHIHLIRSYHSCTNRKHCGSHNK